MVQLVKRTGRVLLVAGALLLASTQAFAKSDHGNGQGQNNDDQGQDGRREKLGGHSVPEINPVAAGAVISVLVGGTLLIAARRRSRKRETAE
jgi:hypothetical protein